MVFSDHIVPTAHHRICVLGHAALVSGLGGYHSGASTFMLIINLDGQETTHRRLKTDL